MTRVFISGPGRVIAVLILALFVSLAAMHAAWAQDDDAVSLNSRRLIFAGQEDARAALQWLRERGRPDAAAAMIMAFRYSDLDRAELAEALAELTGDPPHESWFDWMLWQQAHPEVTPHPSFAALKLELLMHIDPQFSRFIQPGAPMDIRIEEVTWGGVRVDGIPALTNPKLIPAGAAGKLLPEEPVFGVEINGDARAYPLRFMDWHEMFNDVIGGVPVSLAYCTLCGAGILFDTTVAGRDTPFTFGSSGLLYRSNKVMYDHQTDSLWNQFTGKPVSGPLLGTGIELKVLPVAITRWDDWVARHPDTKVLAFETGYTRDYRPGRPYGTYFASDELMFPAALDDPALREKDVVFGVRTAGGAKAWPLAAFAGGRVINDRVGFNDVVLIGDADTRSVRAYARDGQDFAAGADATTLTAEGATWRVTEDALVSADGTRLQRLPGHLAYWFAWAGYLGDEAEYSEVSQ